MAGGGEEISGKKKEERLREMLYLPFGKMFKNRWTSQLAVLRKSATFDF